MKNITIVLILISFVFACQDETETPTQLNIPASYSIEGKWRLRDADNQLYIFQDGKKYTIYCREEVCNWDTFTIASASPNVGTYTFENDTLTINQQGPGGVSKLGGLATYKCDGNVLTIEHKNLHMGSEYDEVIYRLGYKLEDCTE